MKSDSGRAEITRDEALELYYYMRLNRSLDELLVRLFRQNKVVGGLYSSLGQEATSIGTAYALGKNDWIAPLIRNVGSLLVHGYRPRDIMTQYMARATSPTQGKDGTCHFGDLKVHHVISPISMLGDLIPVMAGVAMAGRYLGQKIVALTWIGDGGTSTGAFHEGMNLAAVQRVPLVVVLENNQWAYSTPVNRQAPIRDFADRARAYGIASYTVDGNDLVAVLRVAREAVARAREGRGPVLIEAKTMRMLGHAQHDPAEYVPREMFEYWKARDPLRRYEKYLDQHKLWNEKEQNAIHARIERELAEDLEFAENSPFPPPELAEQGVYCNGCHTIQPQWRRAKEELMPPKSNVKPEWTITNFGGVDAGNTIAVDRIEQQESVVEPGVINNSQNDRKRKAAAPVSRRERR
ncbi:MAG TPA: thiamine pyrophosphate-dependent dehydrogenase E1 component subunit alpha [Candidatus Acidoferrales bacterium]|jgi:pyruvate dehydrogenase E1 component alpha subunit/2-oxoisovalerate dehydrogenase E1 component alpha subunit|nr:thiamine pyrophosphate-dependent dehydrogenase E1 component subunit alpha [Candidatus Acidoferrales bacterium]